MEEKIRDLIESFFVTVPSNVQLVTLKKNITNRMIDRYYKYVDSGKTPGEAFDAIAASSQEVYDAIDNVLQNVGNMKNRYTSGHAPFTNTGKRKNRSWHTNGPYKYTYEEKNDKFTPKTAKRKKRSISTVFTVLLVALAIIFAINCSFVATTGSLFSNVFHDLINLNIDQQSDSSAIPAPYPESYIDEPESANQAVYNLDNTYIIEASKLRDVNTFDLNWYSGSISIVPADGDDMVIHEKAEHDITKESALSYYIDNGMLSIKDNEIGDLIKSVPTKSLEIELPRTLLEKSPSYIFDLGNVDLTLKNIILGQSNISVGGGNINLIDISCGSTLSLDTFSASTSISGEISNLEFTSKTGDLNYNTNHKLSTVNADSLSGNIDIYGNIHRAGVNTETGIVNICSHICPYMLNISCDAGQVNLTVPKQSDFTLSFSSETGILSSDLTLVKSQDKYIHGDAIAAFNVTTQSSGLNITKYTK